jgi:hypothetical protein
MAPEQVRADHELVGPAADVHALGAMFFEMVTGRPPFQGDSTYDTLLQVLREPAPSLRQFRPQVPRELDEFCRRCLAKEPEDRPADAGEAVRDLEQRWRRCRAAAQYRRLTGFALLTLIVLHVLWLASTIGLGIDGYRVAEGAAAWAPQQPALQTGAGLIAGAVLAVATVAAPYLVQVGLMVWLACWVWNAERPGWVAGAWAAAAVVLLLLSLLPGLSFWREGPLYLAWLVAGNALVAAVTMVGVSQFAGAIPAGRGQPGAVERSLPLPFAGQPRGRGKAERFETRGPGGH